MPGGDFNKKKDDKKKEKPKYEPQWSLSLEKEKKGARYCSEIAKCLS